MNSKHLERYLQTLGDRVRFDLDEHVFLRKLGVRDLNDSTLVRLLHTAPGVFVTAIAYLAWRDLVSNGQCNKEGYVFWSSLLTVIKERKVALQAVLNGMTYQLDALDVQMPPQDPHDPKEIPSELSSPSSSTRHPIPGA